MKRTGLWIVILLFGSMIVSTAVAVDRTSSVFAGFTRLIGPETELRDVATTVRFEIPIDLKPAPASDLGCLVAFPEGSFRRRYRAVANFTLTCDDDQTIQFPPLTIKSGRGVLKGTVEIPAPVSFSGCQAPTQVEARLMLKGGRLGRFLRKGIVPPDQGLALDLVCGAGPGFLQR